jgi:F-type H+-transporting ATPase subunit gamma
MANLKDIRRQITSVKSTQKITRAMKLVSAAKFARANTAVVASRPYGQAFDLMVEKLVSAAEATGQRLELPLLAARPEKKILVAVLSTDRGFCGGLNTNLFKSVAAFVGGKRKEGIEVEVIGWGKRARQNALKLRYKLLSHREKVLEKPRYELASELSGELIKAFEDGGFDHVYVAFVEFKSAMTQAPKVLQLLPVGKIGKGDRPKDPNDANIIVEPSIAKMLPDLLKREIASLVFRALLEGSASEHGARMTAMDSATNNATEVLNKKKIQYNRARQAAITKELIEITSGAQAL